MFRKLAAAAAIAAALLAPVVAGTATADHADGHFKVTRTAEFGKF